MSTIVTRAGKGSALTHTEVDANFTNLNTDKLQSGNTAASLTITSATINGGAINGTTVGATTPAAGTFTSLSDSGNLAFTGTGNRITGDFSNATVANRVMFQTSTVNSNTRLGVIPNGTAQIAALNFYNTADPTNSSFFGLLANASESQLNSGITGTGTYLPMTFYTGGSERMRVDTLGNVGIGTSSPGARLDINGLARSSIGTGTGAGGAGYAFYQFGTSATATENWHIGAEGDGSFRFYNQGFGAGIERARIDSSGNLLIGQTSLSVTTVGVGVNPAALVNISKNNSTSGGTGLQIYSTAASAYRFYVNMAGTIFATSTTISAISDQRFKENVRDLDSGLSEVMSLRPRLFDWKEGKGANTKNARGFIAQEFEQVFPDLIDEWKDPAPEGEVPYKSVRQDLIPVLVKAIQELKSELDATKAEVAALKGA